MIAICNGTIESPYSITLTTTLQLLVTLLCIGAYGMPILGSSHKYNVPAPRYVNVCCFKFGITALFTVEIVEVVYYSVSALLFTYSFFSTMLVVFVRQWPRP